MVVGFQKKTSKKYLSRFLLLRNQVKSSGLGLSISHGIINNHKGRLLVTSKEMKGSTFTIELPIE